MGHQPYGLAKRGPPAKQCASGQRGTPGEWLRREEEQTELQGWEKRMRQFPAPAEVPGPAVLAGGARRCAQAHRPRGKKRIEDAGKGQSMIRMRIRDIV
jgi:hypothetical protein